MRPGSIRLGLLAAGCLAASIIMAAPALARSGTIYVGGSSGPPGINVGITGEGFTPDSTFTVMFGPWDVAHGIVDLRGSFSATFAVPERAKGRNLIRVETSAYDTSNTVPFDIVSGVIRVIPSSGPPGTRGTVTGEGFTAGSSFTVYFGPDVVAQGPVSPTGAISASFTVPANPRGQSVITVQTSAFDASVSVSFNVPPLQKPYSPILLAPQQGATVSTTTGFNWAPVMDAVAYRFVLATDAALTMTVAGTPVTVSTPSFQATKPLEPDTAYFWSVQVASPDNSPASVGTFYTAAAPVKPAPAPTVVLRPTVIVEPALPLPEQAGPTYIFPGLPPVYPATSPAPFAAVILISAIFVAAAAIVLLHAAPVVRGAAPVDTNEADLFLAIKSGASSQPLAEALARPGLAARALAEFEGLPAPAAAKSSLMAALSPEELRILGQIAAGKTPRNIARELRISEEAVRQGLAQVADKIARNWRARAAIERFIDSLGNGGPGQGQVK